MFLKYACHIVPFKWPSRKWKTIRNRLLVSLGWSDLVTKSYPTLATPWIVACQAPLSMGFSRQEYSSGLPFLSPSVGVVVGKCVHSKGARGHLGVMEILFHLDFGGNYINAHLFAKIHRVIYWNRLLPLFVNYILTNLTLNNQHV